MSPTTVRELPAAHHATAQSLALTLRRIADSLDEITMPISETMLDVSMQVKVIDGNDELAQTTVELLNGSFHDKPPAYISGLYKNTSYESSAFGAWISAYGEMKPPKRIIEAAELAAYAEQEQRDQDAKDQADRAQADRALAAIRALPASHTPEEAIAAIVGALGIPVGMGPRTCRMCGCTGELGAEGGCTWVADDLCSECAVRPRFIETSADIIDGQGDRWIYLGNDRYMLSDAAGLELSRHEIRERYGIPNETAAERAEYDRRAGEASAQLGEQIVTQRFYEEDDSPDDAVIAATVDTITDTPKHAALTEEQASQTIARNSAAVNFR